MKILILYNIIIVVLGVTVVKLYNDLIQKQKEHLFLLDGLRNNIREVVLGSKNNVNEDITNNISDLLITSNSDREKYISMICEIKNKQKQNIEKMLKEDNMVDDDKMVDIFTRIMLKVNELEKKNNKIYSNIFYKKT